MPSNPPISGSVSIARWRAIGGSRRRWRSHGRPRIRLTTKDREAGVDLHGDEISRPSLQMARQEVARGQMPGGEQNGGAKNRRGSGPYRSDGIGRSFGDMGLQTGILLQTLGERPFREGIRAED